MKNIITLVFLCIVGLASSQIVNIPDVNFKNRLIDNGFDTNNDNEIQVSEAEAVSFLTIDNENISDLTGIEAFVNILRLKANNNQIATIDLSNNQALEEIEVQGNLLTNLNLDSNNNLVEVIAHTCQIESLSFSNHPLLEILVIQANQITTLDISGAPLLDYIEVTNNLLTSIDISNNPLIRTLRINNNELESIDISMNTNIESVSASDNQITTAYINGATSLGGIDLRNNQISSLDLSNSPALVSLNLYNNDLSTLEINNPNLRDLDVNFNQLTDITFNANVIENLDCRNNLFTSLDLSNMQNFVMLSTIRIDTNPNLVYVNLKNGRNFIHSNGNATIPFTNVPNLEYVCLDGLDSPLAFYVTFGSNGVPTEYCSFTPGGDFNTITGNITFDSQNDGCDSSDDQFPFIKINIDDGSDTGSSFTDSNGAYSFYTLDGNFNITPDIENPSFFNVTPIETDIFFPDTNNNIEIQDFCITSNGVHNDVEIVIAPFTPARPGFEAEYLITYKNKGNQTLSGDFSFTYDDTVLDYISATETPTSQVDGLLSWDYSNLLPFESRSVYVTLNVNAPTDTPAVNIGDELILTAIINPVSGDELPDDNEFDFNQTVVGSFDPNNIICIEGEFVSTELIGEYLHYIINFENTGNAAAENIVIRTEVNLSMFDVNGMRLLSSSHNPIVKVENNIIEIIFDGINLTSGGHGNILLKIPTLDSLVINDTVTNNAEIYFDYNFPIDTNNANTTFAQLSVTEFDIDESVILYPNPVNDMLTVTAKQVIKSLSIYDVQGRLLQTKLNNNTEVKIDFTNRSPGVYFVKIITQNGFKVEKVIKD